MAQAVPRLILAAAECAEPVSETRHEALAVELSTAVVPCLARIEDVGAVEVDPAAIPMAEAEFILSGGNGVKDWTLFHKTASALGATEGASRVAVDDGFMGRERQVGASGTWVTARVYVAVGISGAIQHLQGIGACDKVVAINLDPGCDMIKRADLSVIGDGTAVLQALIAAVEQWRGTASVGAGLLAILATRSVRQAAALPSRASPLPQKSSYALCLKAAPVCRCGKCASP